MKKYYLLFLVILAITCTACKGVVTDQQSLLQPSETTQPPTLTAEATFTPQPTVELVETEVAQTLNQWYARLLLQP